MTKAKSDFGTAKDLTDASKKDERKRNAEQSGNDAESAKTEAEKAKTPTQEATNIIEQVKKEYKNVEIALYKVKTILAAEKVNTAFQSIQLHHRNAVKKKSAIDAIVQEIQQNANVIESEGLKTKATAQHGISATAQSTAESEVSKVNNAQTSAKTRHNTATKAVEDIKSKTTLDDAKAEFDKTEKTIKDAESDVKSAEAAYNMVVEQEKKVKIAQHTVNTISDADKVLKSIQKAKEYVQEAEVKKSASKNVVGEIKTLSTDDLGETKTKVNHQIADVTASLGIVEKETESAAKASENAEKQKQISENAIEAVEKTSDVTDAESEANKAKGAATTASQSESEALTHLNKVKEEEQKIEKAKHIVKAVLDADKAKKAFEKAKEYAKEAKKVEKEAESALKEIDSAAKKALDAVKPKITEQLSAAKKIMEELQKQVTLTTTAIEDANTQNTEAQNAEKNALTAQDANKAQVEAGKANTAATKAEDEKGKALVAFQNVKTEAEKIAKINYLTKVMHDAANANKLYKDIQKDHQEAAEQKKTIDTILTEMEGKQSECPKTALEELKRLINVLKIAQHTAESELNAANDAQTTAQQEMVKSENALSAASTDGVSLETLKAQFSIVTSAITEIQKEVGKANAALIKVKNERKKAETTKYEAWIGIASAKATDALSRIKESVNQIAQQKDEGNTAVVKITDMHSNAKSEVQTKIQPHLQNAKVAFASIEENAKNAEAAAGIVNASKENVDATLQEAKGGETNAASAKILSDKATNAASDAEREADKVDVFLANVTAAVLVITSAKQEAENIIHATQQVPTDSQIPVNSKEQPALNTSSIPSGVNQTKEDIQTPPNTNIKERETATIGGSGVEEGTSKENIEKERETSDKIDYTHSNSNTEENEVEETQRELNTNVAKKSDSVNVSYHIFYSLLFTLLWTLFLAEVR